MIELMMKFGGEVILVVIRGNNVSFGNTAYGGQMSTIEGLKLDKKGVVKEFPELKDNDNWRHEAIIKFKEKIRTLNDEEEICNYILSDLSKYGYVPWKKKKQGRRPETIK